MWISSDRHHATNQLCHFLCHSRPAALPVLDAIPLTQLLLSCDEQIDRFRRRAESDPRFCLELFRRAIDTLGHEAWRGLIELYRPLLIARLKRDGIDPEIAEEAVQEACFMLWLKSDAGMFSTRERTLAEVLSYLWGSVRFARIKLQRQQRDLPLLVDNEAQVPLPPIESSATIERMIDARALLIRVRVRVTQHEWQIFWLRFARELPPREIATRLGVSVEEIHL